MALTYFGSQVSVNDDSGASDIEIRGLFTCPQSGLVGELSALLWSAFGPSPTARLAIYDATGTTLIAQGTAAVAVSGASPGSWQGHFTQADITPNPVSLVAGTQYQLVMSGSGAGTSSQIGMRTDPADTPDSVYTLNDYTAGFPSALPTIDGSVGATTAVRCGILPATGGGETLAVGRRLQQLNYC